MALSLRSWPMVLFACLLTGAATARAACPGYSVCPVVNYPAAVARNPQIAAALAAIDTQEAASVRALAESGLTAAERLALLGQALAFDRSLSAKSNQACAFCHSPAAGFAGGFTAFAPAGGILPGTVVRRTGQRAPLSLAYGAFAPILAYDSAAKRFTGGNFWDARATGLTTGSPAVDQAAFPLTNPAELALPDEACVVRRIALAPYATVFAQVYGAAALAIAWPANVDKICVKPNNRGGAQTPLVLSAQDRSRIAQTIVQFGTALATYEQSPLLSPFTAKADAVFEGKVKYTDAELRGVSLFIGSGKCITCHDITGKLDLLTNFTAVNTGIPRNPALPFLTEDRADPNGYVGNPAGTGFTDEGFGGFLASDANRNARWKALAPLYRGAFQVPTLRNVAAGPAAGYTRTYMHNGFFKNLPSIVHFYNTRDVLPRCTGTKGVGVTCWPAAEEPANVSQVVGNLGLTQQNERDIVAFLGTLTDGYVPPGAR